MDLTLKEYIKEGFDRLEKKLDAININTAENNQKIALLESKVGAVDKDVDKIAGHNRAQHEEFYNLLKGMRSEIDILGPKELKSDVKRHDSELDKLSGAFKIAAWLTCFLFSVIGVALAIRG